jgi:hypothetical protein
VDLKNSTCLSISEFDRLQLAGMITFQPEFGSSWPRAIAAAATLLLFASALDAQSNAVKVSDKPETPFKLATFEAEGKLQTGLVFGSRVVDIARANIYLSRKAHLPAMILHTEMRALIEQYETPAWWAWYRSKNAPRRPGGSW